MKKWTAFLLTLSLLLSGCGAKEQTSPDVYEGVQIKLSDSKITVDETEISSDDTQSVYAANDIVFYEAGKDFTYGEGDEKDAHEQSEADSHKVVHISKPGTYIISGKLSAGQIAVDLGKEAKEDPNAVVTLVLNGVDITCEVAPAVIFYNVFECGSDDEETATKDVDTSKAGANVIIADNSENNINGSYVAKIYKTYTLNDDKTQVIDSKKLHKYDGAFYSKQSMNINGGTLGNGVLNINAENEGLDSELHLTINGGVINIVSGNDGINTNEDNVSVTTVNGGSLNILCNGSTGEGDGIDSNGWLVINGGTITSQACATSGDAGIDSDMGIYINGGSVIATGNMLDHIAGGDATYAVFSFASRQAGDNTYTLKNASGKAVWKQSVKNAFSYLIITNSDLVPGEYTFWQGNTQLAASSVQNMGGMGQERPNMPNGGQGKPDDAFFNQFNGQDKPDLPNGDFKPDGQMGALPDGVTPPNGQGGMTPPNGFGGMPGGNMAVGETSKTFTIVKGANQFANVSAAK